VKVVPLPNRDPEMKTALDTFREAKTPDMCQWMLACMEPATKRRAIRIRSGQSMEIPCCESCFKRGDRGE
jgi:hypothetical protein